MNKFQRIYMKNYLFALTIFIAHIFVCSQGSCQVYRLNQLSEFTDALNIEGGIIAKCYLRPNQIWANICVVLDRPFADGIEWNEITKNNHFPLKETSIQNYNEAKVNLAYAAIMHYYITHAHLLTNKPQNNAAEIAIQVHRNTSGPKHVELLKSLLHECYPKLIKIKSKSDHSFNQECFTYYFPEYNVKAIFYYGTYPEVLEKAGKYVQPDIILSYSLVAGLNPQWSSGSLLIPNHWIPIALDTMELHQNEKYYAENHLQVALNDILKSQTMDVVDVINRKFCSKNHLKQNQIAEMLVQDDFHSATLLQVDGMFNPSKLAQTFSITEK